MTTISRTVTDSRTMLRRELLHQRRYPSVTVLLVGMPVVFLLLFVYVFGATMGAGLGSANGGRAEYLAYVVPGVLMLAIAAVAQGSAISVATDMTEGIIARFRTMSISRAAVLTGHVIGSTIQSLLAMVVVLGVAVAMGFRPTEGPLSCLVALAFVTMITFAITWLGVALGMASKTVEAASNVPMPLLLLPFLGSGFVPTESMPTVLAWFATYQPFTPFIETLRGLLMGTPIGNSAVLSIVWCIVIGLTGYLWSRSVYDRRSVG